MSDDSEINRWIYKTFRNAKKPIFLDIGSHQGGASRWLSTMAWKPTVHAFEPDPRNLFTEIDRVVFHREAIAAYDGECDFILSDNYASSSIRKPTGHLDLWPEVGFGETIKVRCMTLDTFIRREKIKTIDFIWADVQGAEIDMIEGGKEALRRTRYMYTEVCPDDMPPWYEGQIKFTELLEMLPAWSVIKHYPTDALLQNMEFV